MNYFSVWWRKIIKSHSNTKRTNVRFMFPLFLGTLAILGASVISADKSYVKLVPSQTNVLAGDRFNIQIYASAHVPVNALDITIDFIPGAIEIIGVDKEQSVLTIWTQEPTITSDSIKLSGGTFQKGFVGEHLIATIKAKANTAGQTDFIVSDASLLAGDGKGTPVAVKNIGSDSKTTFFIYDQDADPSELKAKLGVVINTDINGDGKVTLTDISAFMASWRTEETTYDFNSDGKMNFVDFSIILAKSFLN
jgi:hypothetical protein